MRVKKNNKKKKEHKKSPTMSASRDDHSQPHMIPYSFLMLTNARAVAVAAGELHSLNACFVPCIVLLPLSLRYR